MTRTILSAALAAAITAPAAAAPFTLIIYETPADLAQREGDGAATVDY